MPQNGIRTSQQARWGAASAGPWEMPTMGVCPKPCPSGVRHAAPPGIPSGTHSPGARGLQYLPHTKQLEVVTASLIIISLVVMVLTGMWESLPGSVPASG